MDYRVYGDDEFIVVSRKLGPIRTPFPGILLQEVAKRPKGMTRRFCAYKVVRSPRMFPGVGADELLDWVDMHRPVVILLDPPEGYLFRDIHASLMRAGFLMDKKYRRVTTQAPVGVSDELITRIFAQRLERAGWRVRREAGLLVIG